MKNTFFSTSTFSSTVGLFQCWVASQQLAIAAAVGGNGAGDGGDAISLVVNFYFILLQIHGISGVWDFNVLWYLQIEFPIWFFALSHQLLLLQLWELLLLIFMYF